MGRRTRRRHPRPGYDPGTSRPRTPSFRHASVRTRRNILDALSRALKAVSVFQHVNGDWRRQRERDPGVLEQNVRASLVSRLRWFEDTYGYLRSSRSDRQDFQARGYGGLHGGSPSRHSLSHSVSFSFNESRHARKVSSTLRVNAKFTMIIQVIRWDNAWYV